MYCTVHTNTVIQSVPSGKSPITRRPCAATPQWRALRALHSGIRHQTRHDPSACSVEFVRPCLCVLSQCSAPTQGRRRWACGVIGWERWNGACNGIERTGRECTEGLLFDAVVMVRWWVVRRWLEGLSVRGVLGVTLSHTLSLTCVLNCGSDMFWSLFSLFWGGPWVTEVAAGWPWVVVG